MFHYIFPLIGLGIIVLSGIAAYKQRHNTSKCISSILLGVFFSTLFMVLPTQWVKEGKEVFCEPLYAFLSSLLYSFKTLGGRQDIAQLESIVLPPLLQGLYIGLNYISFVLAPVLTSGLILSFFGDTGEKMRYAVSFSERCYVFSALNENSLALAKGIRKAQKKAILVFCDTKDSPKDWLKNAKALGGITLHKPCENLPLSTRHQKYVFCLISPCEDNNINTAEALIEKHRFLEGKQMVINAFAESGTNVRMLESLLQSYQPSNPCAVFDALTEETLATARSLRGKATDTALLFCDVGQADGSLRQQAQEMGAVLSRHTWQRQTPFARRENYVYTLYQTEEDTLSSRPLKVKNRRFTTDWVENEITLRFVDEIALFCNQLLYEHPLYDMPSDRRDISVMIVGCGKTGMRMLKTVSWAGQIEGYSLKIRVYDKEAVAAKRDFYRQCPELALPEYDIKFIDTDVNGSDFEEKLLENGGGDTTYAVIAMGDDEMNISTADALFAFFRRYNGFTDTPPIFCRVRAGTKSGNFGRDNRFLTQRNITLFGNADSIFSEKTLFRTDLEKLAFAVDLCYNRKLDADKNSYTFQALYSAFKTSEYNRRSSMAGALHIGAKLQSFKLLHKPPLDKDMSQEELLTAFADAIGDGDNPLTEALARSEHTRWNAFMRSEGYRTASLDTMKVYAPLVRKNRDDLSKLHACLTSWKDLDDVSATYRTFDFASAQTDFKDSDIMIVKHIPQILDAAKRI